MVLRFLNEEIAVKVHNKQEKQALLDMGAKWGYPPHGNIRADSFNEFPFGFYDSRENTINFANRADSGKGLSLQGMTIVPFQDFADAVDAQCDPEVDLAALF